MTELGGVDAETLSAYLDGEVSPAERAMVEAALATSEDARSELDALRRARQLLRDLPRLQPPPELRPLLRGPARRPRRIAVLAVGAALTVLAWTVLISSKDAVPGVDVPVAEAVELHQTAESPRAAIAQPRWAPAIAGYDLVEETRDWDMRVARYRSDAGTLSLFERPGHVRWDLLPAGTVQPFQGVPVWRGMIDGYGVAVAELRGHVFIVVTDDLAPAVQATSDLEAPGGGSRSLWSRLGSGCHDTIDVLSLSG